MISSQVSKLRGGYQWFIVVAHAGREREAKMHLERQGFEVYLPMMAPLTSNRQAKPRPFLPRYMFVSVDLNRPGWRAIHSTIGVASLLTTGQGVNARPRPIPPGIIERIQAREVMGLVVLPEKPKAAPCPHKPGDHVKVPRGHGPAGTADLEAVFEERVDAKRVSLLLSLLGREHRVVVPLSSIV